MDSLDSYLATVDELVEDENKIITYKSLSHQLALPVDKAKEVLQFYAKSCEEGKISVTYALTGKVKCHLQITVVPEDKLDFAKSQMDIVLGCHVYSVQKAKLTDVLPLYSVDYDITRNAPFQCASFSSIRFHGAKQVEQRRNVPLEEATKTTILPSNLAKEKSATNRTAGALSNNSSSTKESRKADFGTKKPNAISEAFKKAAKPKDNNQPIDEPLPKTEVKSAKSKPGEKKNKGLDAFMTKGRTDLFKSHETKKKQPVPPDICSAEAASSYVDPNAPLNEEELKALSEELDVVDFESNNDEKMETDTLENKTSSNEASKKVLPESKPEKKKKRRKGSPVHLPKKKRSRIKELSSSSSESESDRDDFDKMDIIPPSPPAINTRSPEAKNPRKKRVLKSRTYFDADGSMLTEKVYEEVSCSSDDDTDVKKTNESSGQTDTEKNSNPIFKKKAVLKGKQASIMGFFSKKSPT